MDLKKELRQQIISYFKKECIRYEKEYEEYTDRQLFIGYLNAVNRRISVKSRKVIESDKIKNIINNKDEEKNIDIINILKKFENDFETGVNMNGHLSTNIFYSNLITEEGKGTKDIKSRDLLLDDWGIYHVHLNEKEAKNKKEMHKNRGNYLLFIYVTSGEVYFIDVMEHKTENFFNIELIETLYENWKFILEPYKLKGGVPEFIPTSEDYINARKSGAVLPIVIDGNMFYPIGGGLTTAKTNARFTDIADTVFQRIRVIEEECEKNNRLDLHLELMDKSLNIVDNNKSKALICNFI